MQLLKTAQRRHPRNGQLHQKIQNLERQIKNKSKVNYYKARLHRTSHRPRRPRR